MEFTTACFIKKNTPELRRKLEEFGYENRCVEEGIYLRTHYKNTIGQNTFRSRNDIPLEGWDCGINEELFLAISALRDDSDINQWYWYNDKLFKSKGGGSTILMNGDRSIKLEIPNMKSSYYEAMKSKLRKATVQELIEHFK